MPENRDPYQQSGEVISRWVKDRQHLLRNEAEDYLRNEVLAYASRQEKYWHRDYTSIESFARSVEPNRQRWREAHAGLLERAVRGGCWLRNGHTGQARGGALTAEPRARGVA